MVLPFLAQDHHLSRADLPDIEESALKVIHCHPKGFWWSSDPSYFLLELNQAAAVAFSKVAFVAVVHVMSARIPSLAGRARCV